MRLMTVMFGSTEDFLRHYSDDYPNGALFCRTRARVTLDEAVLVEVSFPGLSQHVLLRGRIVSTVSGQGAWVHFKAEDRSSARFLGRVARGESSADERSHPRYPAALPVSCRVEELEEPSGGTAVGEVRDLGPGGAYVTARRAPAVGTRVSLTIGPTPSQNEVFTVDGRVAWVRPGEATTGFGVCFDPRGVRDTRRLRSMLRRASETGRLDFVDR